MRFAGNFPKENITYDNSVSDALKVVVLAVVPGTDLPLRDGEGKVVATFKATEGLIRGAISSFVGGVFNCNHEAIPDTMIGVYDSVVYDNGFKVSGSILCPKWKERILSGNYSGVSLEGIIDGEMTNPDSMKVQAVSFLSFEKNSAGGACPLVDSEGNPVCKVEVLQNDEREPEPIEASKPIIIINNNDSVKGDLEMPKKELKAEIVAEEKVDAKIEAGSAEIKADIPEVKVEAEAKIKAAPLDVPILEVPGVKAEVPIAAPIIEPTLDWGLVKNTLGISSVDEFNQIKESAGRVSSLEEKIDKILKENVDLRSYKDDQTKKMLLELYPPAITNNIAAAFAEYTNDPIAFTQKYSSDAVRFAASKNVKLQGSAAESELTEEAKRDLEVKNAVNYLKRRNGFRV